MRSEFRPCARASFFAVIAVAALAGVAACGSVTPVFPSQVNVPFSFLDLTVGTGATAAVGSSVTVDYNGWLYDASQPDNKGQQFTTSSATGVGPLSFVVGSQTVIPGFDQGVTGMRVGGVRRVTIPPALGFGAQQVGNVPPNSTIIFEITLNSIQKVIGPRSSAIAIGYG
jgi:FKBP-type peptidyl-prolyl cis-trans isomerase FkpA